MFLAEIGKYLLLYIQIIDIYLIHLRLNSLSDKSKSIKIITLIVFNVARLTEIMNS